MKTALVLAAGKATRLGPLRDRWAKACVPVAGLTPLGFLLPRLHAAGVEQVVINLHYRAQQVRDEARRNAPTGLELVYLEEPRLLGTGGTLLAASRLLQAAPEFLVNAKLYTDLDFQSLARQEASTLVLHPESSLAEYGGLSFDDVRSVQALRPRRAPAHESHAAVFTGIARPRQDWIDALHDQRRTEHEQNPQCLFRDGLNALFGRDSAPKALLHSGWWYEISTPERVARAAAALREYAMV